jgi:hypothetical protein
MLAKIVAVDEMVEAPPLPPVFAPAVPPVPPEPIVNG